jgi:hypothetical protein
MSGPWPSRSGDTADVATRYGVRFIQNPSSRHDLAAKVREALTR